VRSNHGQGCQIFVVQHTKTGENIPKTTKCTKWQYNILLKWP
jgi:hypothetical protein